MNTIKTTVIFGKNSVIRRAYLEGDNELKGAIVYNMEAEAVEAVEAFWLKKGYDGNNFQIKRD